MPDPLTIRSKQWKEFERTEREKFIHNMIVHMIRLLAPHPITEDPPAMRALVEWGLEFTERLAINRQCDVVRFLELFAYADLNFPKAPQWEWLRLILAQNERSAAHRLDDVYAVLITEGQHHAS